MEKKKCLECLMKLLKTLDDDKTYGYLISYFVEQGRVDKPIKRQFKTYNEAQLACIDVMISSIKMTTLTVKII